jgi:hypothetical protein
MIESNIKVNASTLRRNATVTGWHRLSRTRTAPMLITTHDGSATTFRFDLFD